VEQPRETRVGAIEDLGFPSAELVENGEGANPGEPQSLKCKLLCLDRHAMHLKKLTAFGEFFRADLKPKSSRILNVF
jgi:hypothetical protein